MTAHEFSLTLPRQRDFYEIAHLVVGGIALRLDLTYESLDDLQLALRELLERAEDGGPLTVEMRFDGATIHTRVGPVDGTVRAELERPEQEHLGLRRILDAFVDDVRLTTEAGESWVELTKTVEIGGRAA